MPSFISNRSVWRLSSWALASGLAVMPLQARAKTFHTDAVFSGPYTGPGAYGPAGGLAVDAQGRLYGVTGEGGAAGLGAVYRLTPGTLKSDPWTVEILHSFTGPDGYDPYGSVYLDSAGAVYGTTNLGGTSFAHGYGGHGVAYRLDNLPGWPITVLHSFSGRPDGDTPFSGLAPGRDGLLYGSTSYGGQAGVGTVFAVSPLGDSVSYQIIYSFTTEGAKGRFPGTFSMKPDGAIYGTVETDHANAVFQLVEKDGAWRERLIYRSAVGLLFSLTNGPNGTLFLCSDRPSGGDAIQISPSPDSGQWAETTLYKFAQNLYACSSLTINPSGGFVGATDGGGLKGAGALFSLTQASPGTGAYTLQTLHRFSSKDEGAVGSLLRLGGLYYGATGISTDLGGSVFDVRP